MKNKSLNEIISEISERFILEAERSPTLMTDMAAMEKYLAESYNDRVFIELLQNADDCGSCRVIVRQIGDNLYFANDGRPFSEADVLAICRSGASSKQRGVNIGYRGVGFKSATYLSNDILIYSNHATFAFSKNICAKRLGVPEECVPIIRVPFLVENLASGIEEEISELVASGYQTVFVFKNAQASKFMSELKNIGPNMFIFLNHILECNIQTAEGSSVMKFFRKRYDGGYDFIDQACTNRSWHVLQGNNSLIAFKTKNENIVPCDANEAMYHSYLPTLDKAPFKVKINGDFSTDPSRKHLTIDEFTTTALIASASLIANIIQSIFMGKIITGGSQLLMIFKEQGSFSSANSVLCQELKRKIKTMKLNLNGGQIIPISQYKILPDWLDEAERNAIRMQSGYVKESSLPPSLYDHYVGIDGFIEEYSDSQFMLDDMIAILSDKDFSNRISEETYGKLVANVVRKAKIESQLHGKQYSLDSILLPKGNGSTTEEINKIVGNQLSNSEILWINKTMEKEIFYPKKADTPATKKANTVVRSKKPTVTKWRSAEQQVVQIEEFLGNKPIDVSKQNLGYDIEATTPTGEKRYIEVKSVSNEYGGFSITNNEYTAAHQFSNQYYICLIFEKKAIYIQNPLSTLHFEKRIRQWEWLCEEYDGEEIEFSFK